MRAGPTQPSPEYTCSKLAIEALWRRSGVFIVNFEIPCSSVNFEQVNGGWESLRLILDFKVSSRLKKLPVNATNLKKFEKSPGNHLMFS